MSVEALRSELEALLNSFAKTGAHDAPSGKAAEAVADTAETRPNETRGAHAQALRALADYLAGRAGDAEDMLSAHPFAAISAAFMLGVAIGRISR